MIQKNILHKKASVDLERINLGDDNRDFIISHLESGGVIELTELQEKLLERWVFADEIIRRNVGKKRREEIANLIKERFGVSRITAYKDIIDAEFVFSSSTPLNKKYTIGLRIELLEREISKAIIAGKTKEHAMLESCLLKYLEMYPDGKPTIAPRTFIFNIDNRGLQNEIIETEDADFIINEALNTLPNAAE
jgi:hypothetical protein